jgi:hypothetical protein
MERGYARRMIWTDDVLASDIRHHFSDYYTRKERWLERVRDHDAAHQQIDVTIKHSLTLPNNIVQYRSTLARCAGEEMPWDDRFISAHGECRWLGCILMAGSRRQR